MRFLYNSAIHILSAFYHFASLFHPKAKLFVEGRKNSIARLKDAVSNNTSPIVWIHCASLGEFEQGRPIIESIRKDYPAHRILLTFFSPSGYEIQKNYTGVDYVFYLPLDTRYCSYRFVSITRPILAIFVKYEFWNNYTRELQRNKIPMISVSAIFRDDQIFFKPWGGFNRAILRRFNQFFVQNQESVTLLNSIGINEVIVAGDTRFDRVYEITQRAEEIPAIQKFKSNEKVFVIGSCWPEDIDVLAPFINENQYRLKFIIAPHEIKEEFLSSIEASVQGKVMRFSQIDGSIADAQVLLIDNIGMLSKLYRYGEFAWVGGGFGKGLHNILEAACYGVPIFFGNKNYQKFKEANDLILRGGAFEIGNFFDLKAAYEMLLNRPENFLLASEVTRQYVRENLGATKKIMTFCSPYLRK